MKSGSGVPVAAMAILLLGLLSGCSPVVKAAKQAIESTLTDPGSVQYRNVSSYSEGVVCGEVNGKNTSGGYVGFRGFIYNAGGNNKVWFDAFEERGFFCNDNANKKRAYADHNLAESKKYCQSGADPVRQETECRLAKTWEAARAAEGSR